MRDASIKPTDRLDALRRLLVDRLGYDYADEPVPFEAGDLSEALAASPRFIARTGGGFHVIHTRLAATATRRGTERKIVDKLLRDHPYALYLFSDERGVGWTFLNVKLVSRTDAAGNCDGKSRRVYRRISVAPGDQLRTAVERIELLSLENAPASLFDALALDVQKLHDDAFDVEAVTSKFFKTYKRVFEHVEQRVVGIAGTEPRRLFTQRLFNRLMFLAFVQKKGWLTPPAQEHGDPDYLARLWAHYSENKKARASFYDDRLRPLFFEGLAKPGHDHAGRIGRVPYLNGGLFEHADDGTDLNAGVGGVTVPDDAIGLILSDLFAAFNFTVHESTPLDVEVAVDPEMLGKVFEELVTGRHESGSYYTPKPIVSFMCREALKGHLAGTCPSESAGPLATFVDEHDPSALREPESVLDALRNITACDPACGSGAYLLGLLHELLDLRAALFAAGASDADRVYERKQQIIQNNLYGVDLDPFAVNIAQLRLWLSLAVEYDGPDPKPLPSLTFKIGVGDSLVAPDPGDAGQLSLQREVVLKYKEAKDVYGDPFTDAASRRGALEKATAFRDDLRTWLRGTGQSANGFDWAVEFAEVFAKEQPGFDVVLANPPYVRQELIKHNKAAFKANFPDIYGGGADLCCYFYGRAIQLLRPGGVLAFISTNKWMRAEYGQTLRKFLGEHSRPNTILDFGHSPVFPAADTFPCLPVLTRKATGANRDDFDACPLPREEYDPDMNVTAYVRRNAYRLDGDLLTDDQWLLERPEVHALLKRLRDVGTPLREFCGPPYRGPVSGLNDAFYIDDVTRDRIVAESPEAAEVIRPLLRGRDVNRWRPTP